jgi:hypothetical protein
MSDADADLDFELVTSTRQLATPLPLRKEPVTVPDWPTVSGKAARFLVWEMSAGDYSEFLDSGWTYKEGARQAYDNKGEDFNLLAWSLRDQHGNRLWQSAAEAKVQMKPLGKASMNLLLNAANRVNAAKPASAEGNSDETTSDSQPST